MNTSANQAQEDTIQEQYFVRERYSLQDKNKLETEVRHLFHENLNGVFVTKEQLLSMYKSLTVEVKELNTKFVKVKNKIDPSPIKFYEEDGEVIIRVHDGLTYVAYLCRKNMV